MRTPWSHNWKFVESGPVNVTGEIQALDPDMHLITVKITRALYNLIGRCERCYKVVTLWDCGSSTACSGDVAKGRSLNILSQIATVKVGRCDPPREVIPCSPTINELIPYPPREI